MADPTSAPLTGVSAVPLGQYGESFSFGAPDLSQQTRDYLNVLDIVARGTKPSTGLGNYYNPLSQINEYSNGDVTLPVYMTEAALSPFASKPIEENLAYTALLKGAQGSAGQLSAGPNTPLILVNDKTGEKLVTGTGFQAAEQAAAQAQALTDKEGGKAAWSLYTAAPGTTDYYRTAQSEPQMSFLQGLGKLVSTVGPVLGGALIAPAAAGALGSTAGGALQGISQAAKAGLMGGISAAGGALQGKGLGSILASAVPSAALTYFQPQINKALGSPFGAPTGAPQVQSMNVGPLGTPTFEQTAAALRDYTSSLPGFAAGVSSPLGALADAAGDITVTAPRVATGALAPLSTIANTAGNLISGGSGSNTLRGGAGAPSGAPSANPEGDIEIRANLLAERGLSVGDIAATLGISAATAASLLAASGGGAATGAYTGATLDTTPVSTSGLGTPTAAQTTAALGDYTSTLPGFGTGALSGGGLTLDKAINLLQAGALGTSLLGGLFGGGGKGGGSGSVPKGVSQLATLNPTFTAKLPAPTLPGLGVARTPSTFVARGFRSPQDWYRYGYGPQQLFFADQSPDYRNTSTAYTGYAEGGRAKLRYEDLSPQERNFVDYHRRNLAVRPLERDGDITTIYGMQDEVPGGFMVHPGYIHGEMVDPRDPEARRRATDWAVRSGIDFPVYPDQPAADEREMAIHRDIIEPDTERYARGDRDWLRGYDRGGFAVGGPGDGRDDEIPAMLSDGEYVMDAETVAMLGNGSNKAGAEALDRFRVNIRKHKGRGMAKGSFSAKARKPEQYLKKGRE